MELKLIYVGAKDDVIIECLYCEKKHRMKKVMVGKEICLGGWTAKEACPKCEYPFGRYHSVLNKRKPTRK